jgi:hypothetical protein
MMGDVVVVHLALNGCSSNESLSKMNSESRIQKYAYSDSTRQD